MNEQLRAITKETFDFLSSLKLAVLLLIGFSILLGWATIFESLHGTDEAQRVVYSAIWFDFLIFLLGVNVLCSALKRWPWKMKQIGFLTTHLGIIIILVGSMMTRKMGVEGQVILQEGESTQVMMTTEQTFTLSAPRLGIQESFTPRFMRTGVPEGKAIRYRLGDTGIECFVEEYIANPRHRESYSNQNPSENPAIRLALQLRGEPTALEEEWLLAQTPSRSVMELGFASIRFMRASTEDEFAEWMTPSESHSDDAIQSQSAYAAPQHSGQHTDSCCPPPTSNQSLTLSANVTAPHTDDCCPPPAEEANHPRGVIHLRDASERTIHTLDITQLAEGDIHFDVEGKSYHAQLLAYLPRAGILDGELVNKPDGALNPAIRLHLCSPEGEEEHLTFALYPQFGSIHGNRPNPSGLQAIFEYPSVNAGHTHTHTHARSNQIDIIMSPEGDLHYRAIGQSDQWESGPIVPGESFGASWNNLFVTVSEFIPRALPILDIYDAGKDEHPHNNPIARVRVVRGDHQAEAFVPFNSPRTLMAGDEPVTVRFGQKPYPLGFTLQLVEFRAPRYPGTNRPALFESDVLYMDPENGVRGETKIHMNHPLYYNNFAIYQSSYVEGHNGESNISIFSVARAPGTPTIYFGSIVLVLGMILMFMSSKGKKKKSSNDTNADDPQLLNQAQHP